MIVQTNEPASLMYEVKSGDTLSKIAKAHYGDPMKYQAIFEANQPMLSHPDKIYPGQELRLGTRKSEHFQIYMVRYGDYLEEIILCLI